MPLTRSSIHLKNNQFYIVEFMEVVIIEVAIIDVAEEPLV